MSVIRRMIFLACILTLSGLLAFTMRTVRKSIPSLQGARTNATFQSIPQDFITNQQAVNAAVSLLLMDDGTRQVYLPLIQR